MAAAERELFWKDCGPGTFRYRSVRSHGCHWGRRGDMETCLPEKLAAGLAWEGEGGCQSTCFHGGGIARAPAPSPNFFKVRKRVSRRCIPGSHPQQNAAVRAPVEELWNLSSAWLPGYKIICHQFPEEGAWLGRHERGSWEIVSAVGSAMSTSIISNSHLYYAGQPHCPAALLKPRTAGVF